VDTLGRALLVITAILLVAGPFLTVLLLIFDRERFYHPKPKTNAAVAVGFAFNILFAGVGLWILGVL
jgi:hypothetical protein